MGPPCPPPDSPRPTSLRTPPPSRTLRARLEEVSGSLLPGRQGQLPRAPRSCDVAVSYPLLWDRWPQTRCLQRTFAGPGFLGPGVPAQLGPLSQGLPRLQPSVSGGWPQGSLGPAANQRRKVRSEATLGTQAQTTVSSFTTLSLESCPVHRHHCDLRGEVRAGRTWQGRPRERATLPGTRTGPAGSPNHTRTWTGSVRKSQAATPWLTACHRLCPRTPGQPAPGWDLWEPRRGPRCLLPTGALASPSLSREKASLWGVRADPVAPGREGPRQPPEAGGGGWEGGNCSQPLGCGLLVRTKGAATRMSVQSARLLWE